MDRTQDPSTPEAGVATAGLGRTYVRRRGRGSDEVRALADVDLRIPVGEVHGLLGPNGAGKTTLCKILSTVLLPTAGSARVLGYDVVRDAARVRPLIGLVLGGDRGLYPRLSARQNLRYWAAMYGAGRKRLVRECDALLERVGLASVRDVAVESFSRGMRQRLHLARALVGRPRLLLLDEPTAGMDPVAAREFRGLVEELRSEGRTILLATHDMAEAEMLADRVTLIDRGRVLATEAPSRLSELLSRFAQIHAPPLDEALLATVGDLPGVGEVDAGSGGVRIEIVEEGAATAVLRLLVDHGVTSLRTARPSLEEVYLALVGDRRLDV